MKHLLIPILLLIAFPLFSQKKPAYYYDELGAPISKKDFKSNKRGGDILDLYFDLDTAHVYLKVIRKFRGIMHPDSLKVLKKDIESTAHLVIDSTHFIVINYYPGPDICNATGTKDTAFLRSRQLEYLQNLHTLGLISQFDIYNLPEGLEHTKSIRRWLPDVNHRVRNTFFPLHYYCGSVVVIRPDGHYISYKGEYSKEQVYLYVKELRMPHSAKSGIQD